MVFSTPSLDRASDCLSLPGFSNSVDLVVFATFKAVILQILQKLVMGKRWQERSPTRNLRPRNGEWKCN